MTAIEGLLAQGLAEVDSLSPQKIPSVLATIEKLRAILWQKILAPSRSALPTTTSAVTSDRLLDIKEAAQKLCRSTDWLYRHASELPFVVRDGRMLRFSEQGIESYIRKRMGH